MFKKTWFDAAYVISTRGTGVDALSEGFSAACLYHKLPYYLVTRRADLFNTEGFLDYLKSQDFILERASLTTQIHKHQIILSHDNSLAVITPSNKAGNEYGEKGTNVTMKFNNLPDAEKFKEILGQYVIKETDYRAINLMVIEDGLIGSIPLKTSHIEPFVRENYATNVVDGFDNICKLLKDKNPAGRLHLIEGPPGTGKTHLITGLINDVEAKYIFVPTAQAYELTSPMFMGFLASECDNAHAPIVLIIEDGDALIKKRGKGGGHSEVISAVLNLCDGPVSMGLNLHMIVTFNTHISEIDDAIMRPGRMGTRILVDKLPFEQAVEVHKRLVDGPLVGEEKPYTLAEVYNMSKKANNNFVPEKTKADYGVYN